MNGAFELFGALRHMSPIVHCGKRKRAHWCARILLQEEPAIRRPWLMFMRVRPLLYLYRFVKDSVRSAGAVCWPSVSFRAVESDDFRDIGCRCTSGISSGRRQPAIHPGPAAVGLCQPWADIGFLLLPMNVRNEGCIADIQVSHIPGAKSERSGSNGRVAARRLLLLLSAANRGETLIASL